MNTRQTNPLRRRKFWWLHLEFFLFIGSYAILSVFFLAIIRISELAFQLTGIFWLIMLPIIIWLYKRTLFDDYSVVESVIERTRRDILEGRVKVQREFIDRDIGLLKQGVKTPVLDVWKLNPALAGRHPLFNLAEVIVMDPNESELHIRIRLEDEPPFAKRQASKRYSVKSSVAEFVAIAAHDPYLEALKGFFNLLVIEVYAPRPDDTPGVPPAAILSLTIDAGIFWKIRSSTRLPLKLEHIADVRYNDDREITPHRSIEPPHTTSK